MPSARVAGFGRKLLKKWPNGNRNTTRFSLKYREITLWRLLKKNLSSSPNALLYS
jgi:hypothetical protein